MEEKTSGSKWLGWLVLAIVVIGGGWWLMSHGSAGKVAETHKLKVGAILPTTGAIADFGTIFKNGLTNGLANDPDIEVVYEDSRNDPTASLSAFQKLTTVDNVDVVVSIMSVPTVPLVPVAKQNQVPLVMSMVSTISATAKDNEYVYRLFWTAQDTGEFLADRLIAQGLKRVAILQSKDPASQSNVDVAMPRLQAAGVQVTYETFMNSDTDFRDQLLKVKQANPEAIDIVTIPAVVWKSILTQAKDLGITVPIYDQLGVFMNVGTPEALGALGNGVYTITTPFNVGEYPQEVRDSIIQKTGTAPAGYASFGYDTAALLKELVKNNVTDRASIVSYLKNMKTFEGITSPYVVDDTHNIKPSPVKVQFVNRQIVKSDK